MSGLAAAVKTLVALALVVGTVTFLALEGREVVVLRTRAPDGTTRETRVWVADDGGVTWIEAASPEPGPSGHARIRALLRAKYGLADWWIGRLADTARSVAVRLEPAAPALP